MSLTAAQLKNLPTVPDGTKAVAGNDTILFVAKQLSPNAWLPVGGQKNSAMTQKADTLDASDKSSGNWSKKIAGKLNWSVDYDGLWVLNDDAVTILRTAFRNRTPVFIRQEYPDGSYVTGWANVTAFDDSHANDAISTLKMTLEGYGPISDIQTTTAAAITAPTLSIKQNATTNSTLAVTPTDCTIRSLVDETDTALVLDTDYTFMAGSLVINGSYLANLAVGTKTLTAKFATGDIAITITVTAAS